MTPAIEVIGATRRYGAKIAVDGVDMTLTPGRITCLLGPSGCGKSTLLRLIAGLEPLDAGRILAQGRDISGEPPERRDIGLVFQDYALFPHMNVGENVGFGLRTLTRAEREGRVRTLLEPVHLADRTGSFPGELSGGEQQRVALVRALARAPHTVLMDEPFSGLDSHLKGEVRQATLKALRATDAAVLIVTHDAEEAMQMADDMALMNDGKILQRGTPEDCYRNPVSVAAARLLGEAETLDAQIDAGVAHTAFGDLPAIGLRDGPAQVMVRPDGFVVGVGVPAQVREFRFVGQAWRATLISGETAVSARFAAPPTGNLRVTIDPARARIFVP